MIKKYDAAYIRAVGELSQAQQAVTGPGSSALYQQLADPVLQAELIGGALQYRGPAVLAGVPAWFAFYERAILGWWTRGNTELTRKLHACLTTVVAELLPDDPRKAGLTLRLRLLSDPTATSAP